MFFSMFNLYWFFYIDCQ